MLNNHQIKTPIDHCRPDLGHIEDLPWDAETFGFRVATWHGFKAEDISNDDLDRLRDRLQELNFHTICVSIPQDDRAGKSLLISLGFYQVEVNLTAFGGLSSPLLPKPRSDVRRATDADLPQIVSLAGSIFSHGRYRADPFFPDHLAQQRYADWARRSFASDVDHLDVWHANGSQDIEGFMIYTIEQDVLHLRLGGFAPASPRRIFAPDLWAHAFIASKALGAKRFEAVIAAENLSIVNMYAHWGCRFKNPRSIYHLHQS